jgi:hypothetical protein
MRKSRLLVIICLILSFGSCYYDSEEALFPVVDSLSSKCDTLNISYSGNVAPMINNYCMGCHQIQVPILSTYSAVVSFSDRIYGDIAHKSGYDPMPKNGPILDSCLIKQFSRWINEGKPDN